MQVGYVGRKSQISIFIIIGLLIVVILASFFVIRQSSQDSILGQSEYVFEMGPKQSSLESLISECVKQDVIQAEILYGLRRDWSPQKIEQHMINNLPSCIDNFAKEQKYRTNYGELEVDVEIDREALIVYVSYPMEFQKQDTLLRFENKEYRFPRTVMETIDPSKTTRVVSADGTMILEIPPGTVATLHGQPVDKVGLKQLDREFNGLSNNVVAGNLGFNGIPSGTKFSQPIKIIKYYREEDIGLLHQGDDINIGYYDDILDIWIGIPTEVDIEKRKLTAEIKHFTPFATVSECGEGAGGTITLNDVIYPHVAVCEGWTTENLEWMPAETSGGPNNPPLDFYFECDEKKNVEGAFIYYKAKELNDVWGGIYRESTQPGIMMSEATDLSRENNPQFDYTGTYWKECEQYWMYTPDDEFTDEYPMPNKFSVIMNLCKENCPIDSTDYCLDHSNENQIYCRAVYHYYVMNSGSVPSNKNEPSAIHNVEILFQNSGDSCIYDPDGDETVVEIQTLPCETSTHGEQCLIRTTNEQQSIITITPICENDLCMIPKGQLLAGGDAGNSPTLDFNLFVTNSPDSTEEVCINGGATVDLSGVGSTKMEYNCENEGVPTYIGGECYICAAKDGYSNPVYTMALKPGEGEGADPIPDREKCFDKKEGGTCAIEGCYVSYGENECLKCIDGHFEVVSGYDCPCRQLGLNAGAVVASITGKVISSITGKTIDATNDGLCLDDFDPKNPTKKGGGGGSQTTCTTPEDCSIGQTCEEGICVPEQGGGERPEECAVVDAEQCNEFDLDKYKGEIITTDKLLDTRDRGFCDTFGDLESGAELIIMDSAMSDGMCWIWTESQTVIDGYKPDLYVRYNDIKHLLGELNKTCESDEDCNEGFYCNPETKECEERPEEIIIEPFVGFYDFDFEDGILFEPASLGCYREDNDIVTDDDYTWFIKLNYDEDVNLTETIEEYDEIIGYWLIDTDCSDDTNLSKLYEEYHEVTNIPLVTKMTASCAEEMLSENITFTDIILFDYNNNDDLLDIDTDVKFIPMVDVSGKTYGEINDTASAILENDYKGIVLYPYDEVNKEELDYINTYNEIFCKAKEKFLDIDCDFTPEIPEEITIAFIANQGYNESAYDVINLIVSREPDLIVLNGNLGYDSYDDWSDMMYDIDIPFIGAIGYNDIDDWNDYYKHEIEYWFDDDLSCNGLTGDQMACEFKGILFVVSGVGTTYTTENHLQFINESLKQDNKWKFCIWNKANKDMRISDKPENDDLSLDYYDICREQSSLIITGYDETYARTKLISSFTPITIQDNYNLEDGKTIVFMSGLGGHGNETYNCSFHDTNNWWSTIFSENYYLNHSVQIEKSCTEPLNDKFDYGALFVTLNSDGEEEKAKAEFITINNVTIDSIDINNIN